MGKKILVALGALGALLLGGFYLLGLSSSLKADYGASWAPDGSHLVFYRWQKEEGKRTSTLYRVKSDGTGLKRLTQPDWGFAQQPVYAPDGSYILYTDMWNLWRISPDGSHRIQLSDGESEGLRHFAARFRADGKLAAFDNMATSGRVHFRDMETGRIWQSPVPDGGRPDFFENTDRLVFHKIHKGVSQIFEMKLDGSDLKQLTFAETDSANPIFSADGKVLFIRYDHQRNFKKIDGVPENTEVFSLDLSGGGVETRLTNIPGMIYGPQMSPDGKEIVFSLESKAGSAIHIMSADGSGVRKVS